MHTLNYKPQRGLWIILVIFLGVAVFWVGLSLAPAASAAPPRPPQVADSHLTLTATPPIVTPGTLISLHIGYYNLGLPYTTLFIHPSGIVTYDPPLVISNNITCYGCAWITLRALTTGVVTFTASATGEAYDPDCQCFYWTVAYEEKPAVLRVTEVVWSVFLSLTGR